jgi:hypothetical protein
MLGKTSCFAETCYAQSWRDVARVASAAPQFVFDPPFEETVKADDGFRANGGRKRRMSDVPVCGVSSIRDKRKWLRSPLSVWSNLCFVREAGYGEIEVSSIREFVP